MRTTMRTGFDELQSVVRADCGKAGAPKPASVSGLSQAEVAQADRAIVFLGQTAADRNDKSRRQGQPLHLRHSESEQPDQRGTVISGHAFIEVGMRLGMTQPEHFLA